MQVAAEHDHDNDDDYDDQKRQIQGNLQCLCENCHKLVRICML